MEIQQLGVIRAGTMGNGIAQVVRAARGGCGDGRYYRGGAAERYVDHRRESGAAGGKGQIVGGEQANELVQVR